MSQLLNLGSDVGFAKAFLQKSPRAGNVCQSPLSQASTAPSTPSHGLLPDIDLMANGYTSIKDLPEMMLSLDQSPVAQRLVKDAIAEEDEEEIARSLELSPLQSELGRWAQQEVQKEEHLEKVISLGLPPLQSELGRWAQRQVEAEEWYQAQTQLQEEYRVESSSLQDGTTGLAYRKSKRPEDRELGIQGPAWGSTVAGIDEQDGWVRVGDFYLPMTLSGTRVLTPCSDSQNQCFANVDAMYDGPALTEDGRVVDLDGGSPIFFGCNPILASGHATKLVMMNAIKDAKNAQMAMDAARAAADVDCEQVCSIDSTGVVRGEESLAWRPAIATTEKAAAGAARLKLFSQKRKRRREHVPVDEAVIGIDPEGNAKIVTTARVPVKDMVVSIDPDGKAFLFLYLPDPAAKQMKRRCQKSKSSVAAAEVMSIDGNGIIQD